VYGFPVDPLLEMDNVPLIRDAQGRGYVQKRVLDSPVRQTRFIALVDPYVIACGTCILTPVGLVTVDIVPARLALEDVARAAGALSNRVVGRQVTGHIARSAMLVAGFSQFVDVAVAIVVQTVARNLLACLVFSRILAGPSRRAKTEVNPFCTYPLSNASPRRYRGIVGYTITVIVQPVT